MAVQIYFCTLICSTLIFHICGTLSYLLGIVICYEGLVFHISHVFVSLVGVLDFLLWDLFLAFVNHRVHLHLLWPFVEITRLLLFAVMFLMFHVVVYCFLECEICSVPPAFFQKISYHRFHNNSISLIILLWGPFIDCVWLRYRGQLWSYPWIHFTLFPHVELGTFKYRIAMLYEITVELHLHCIMLLFIVCWLLKWLQNIVLFLSHWIYQCIHLTLFWFHGYAGYLLEALVSPDPQLPLFWFTEVKLFHRGKVIGCHFSSRF